MSDLKMKYVVIAEAMLDTIYLFPTFVKHDDFVARLNVMKADVLAAGFVDMREIRCYGKSISLGVESRLQDTDLLYRQMGY